MTWTAASLLLSIAFGGQAAEQAAHPGRDGGHEIQVEGDRFSAESEREMAAFRAAEELEARTFADEDDRAYREFATQVERDWGTFVPSTQPVWSSYSADRLGHGEVDFEQGTVTLEVLAEGVRGDASPKVAGRMADMLSAMRSPNNPARRDPLEGLIDRGDGAAARREESGEIVSKAISQGAARVREARSGDGRARTIVAVRLAMVPDRLSRAARPFLPLITREAERFGLERELVLGLIQTESSFNPFARSAAPAYGLMQLTPTGGAKEAWRFLHGHLRRVEATELYDAETNVTLGSAYLRVLLDRHFGSIRDPDARFLAAIAAYNCGPQRAEKALASIGGAGKAGAAASEVLAALIEHAPTETRRYVQLVNERRGLWRAATRRMRADGDGR